MSALEYFSENRAPAFAGGFAVLVASVLAYVLLHSSKPQPVRPPPPITAVIIQPPKPPPPPPPLPQPKTIVQPKMSTPVAKPVSPNQPPKATPRPAAPAALGTSLKSNGASNAFDLSGNGSADGCLGCSGTGGGGSYDSAVSYQIQQALQNDPVTRHATGSLRVRVRISPSGLITQVTADQSSGDAALDREILTKILPGMQLPPPPPSEAMPILLSLTGEQPLQ